MKEIWDACDRDGRPLGVALVRGEPVPEGMYHMVCEVIVRHTDGDYLLMLRDPNKPIHPGEWELGAGGSALRGEDAETAARRELFEETGIHCEALLPVDVVVREPCTRFHLFAAWTDCDKRAVTLQAGETVDWRWVDGGALRGMLKSGEVLAGTKTNLLDAAEAALDEARK